MEQTQINFVRNSIDLIVGQDGFPVLENTLIEAQVATYKELRKLLAQGHIKGIDIEAPSQLVAGQTTLFRAYYTERNIPQYVKERLQ